MLLILLQAYFTLVVFPKPSSSNGGILFDIAFLLKSPHPTGPLSKEGEKQLKKNTQ